MPQYLLTIDGQAQDLQARRIVLGRLTVSYRTGRLLSFHQAVRHDQADFQPGQSVLLEVDGAVVFRGQIHSVTHLGRPGDERVEYAAVGLRALSRRVTACEADGLPKLVFNAEPDDEDYRSDRTGMTVGQMLKQLIDSHADQLLALGVITGSGYVQGELDQLDAVPSRVVLRERDFDRAVSEILAHQPGWVFQIHPAEQRYRFQRVDTLPAVTVTVGGDDHDPYRPQVAGNRERVYLCLSGRQMEDPQEANQGREPSRVPPASCSSPSASSSHSARGHRLKTIRSIAGPISLRTARPCWATAITPTGPSRR